MTAIPSLPSGLAGDAAIVAPVEYVLARKATLSIAQTGGESTGSTDFGLLAFAAIFTLAGLFLLYSHAGSYIGTARRYIGLRSFDPDRDVDGGRLVGVRGTISTQDQTTTGPLSDEDCVAFVYKKQNLRLRRRPRNRNSTGSFGNDDDESNKRQWRWTTVDSDLDSVPFTVETDHGPIEVDPHAASLELPVRASENASLLTRLIVRIPIVTLLTKFVGRPEREIERHVKPGDDVTIIGDVTVSDGNEESVAAVDRPGRAGVFTVTTRSGRNLIARTVLKAIAVSIPGTIFLGIGLGVLVGGAVTGMYW